VSCARPNRRVVMGYSERHHGDQLRLGGGALSPSSRTRSASGTARRSTSVTTRIPRTSTSTRAPRSTQGAAQDQRESNRPSPAWVKTCEEVAALNADSGDNADKKAIDGNTECARRCSPARGWARQEASFGCIGSGYPIADDHEAVHSLRSGTGNIV
jgi:hypothetical protein